MLIYQYGYRTLMLALGLRPTEPPLDNRVSRYVRREDFVDPDWREAYENLIEELKLGHASTALRLFRRMYISIGRDYRQRDRAQRSLSRLWETFGGPEIEVCDHCGEWVLTDRVQDTPNGRYCDLCRESYVYTEDGEYMLAEDAYVHRDGCYYSYEQQSGIAEYHRHEDRQVKIRYHAPAYDDPLAKDFVRLGIEWEYLSEDRDADAEAIDDTTYALAEKDGSLCDRTGIEIVTGYSTLTSVCAWVTALGDKINIESTTGAGLHVNLSGLSSRAYAKLICLINSNAGQVRRIAGRWDTEYAGRQPCDLGPWLRTFKRPESRAHRDKYVHVNMRNSYAELRVFDSSDDADTIRGRVQFVWLCAHFCAQPGLDTSFGRLVQWFNATPWLAKHVPDLIAMDVGFTRSGKHKAKPEKVMPCQTVT